MEDIRGMRERSSKQKRIAAECQKGKGKESSKGRQLAIVGRRGRRRVNSGKGLPPLMVAFRGERALV